MSSEYTGRVSWIGFVHDAIHFVDLASNLNEHLIIVFVKELMVLSVNTTDTVGLVVERVILVTIVQEVDFVGGEDQMQVRIAITITFKRHISLVNVLICRGLEWYEHISIGTEDS